MKQFKFFLISTILIVFVQLANGQVVISNFSPRVVSPGSQVVISGSGFNSTASSNKVWIGNVLASVISASSTSLTVNVPTNAVSGELIMITNTGSTQSGTSLLPLVLKYNYSTSTFGEIKSLTTGSHATIQLNKRFQIGDIDGDASQDIVSFSNSNSLKIASNAGTAFLSSSSYNSAYSKTVTGVGNNYDNTSLGDFDADGDLDLLGVCWGYNPYGGFYKNSSTSGNISVDNLHLAVNTYVCLSPSIADLNNDGKLDWTGAYGYSGVNAFIAPSNSTFSSFTQNNSGSGSYTAELQTALADVDSDGKLDVIGLGGYGAAYLTWRKNLTTGTSFSFSSSASLIGTTGGRGRDFRATDFNNDGMPDFVVSTDVSDGTIDVYRNTTTSGTVSFTRSIVAAHASGNTKSIAIVDLNNDGYTDVVCSGSYGVRILLNTTTSTGGSITFASSTSLSSKSDLGSIQICDLNGDGYPEIIGEPDGGGAISILQISSVPTASASVSVAALSGFSTCSGTSSALQSFTVSGSNLGSTNLVLTAPSGFEIKQSSDANYSSSLSFAPANGSVSNKSIDVRISSGSPAGALSGNLTITSGVTSLSTISLSGTVNSVSTVSGTAWAYKSGTTTLTATGTAGSPAWTSSNTNVASVAGSSTTGTVTGVASGTTIITFKNSNGCTTATTVTVYEPVITVSSTSVSAVSACSGVASANRNFTVSGSGIPTNATVTAPSGFNVSTSASSGFASSLTLTASSGTINATTIYVRMASTASGNPLGDIQVTSTNATTRTVSISGTVLSAPTISGGTSVAVNNTLALTGSASAATSNAWATSNSSIASISGTTGTSVTVTGVAAGSANITYTNSDGCSTTQAVSVVVPTITTSGTPSSFTTCSGVASTAQSFTASGSNLNGDITVSAPTGFEVSLSSSSGYSSSLTLTASSGTVSSTTVYVRVSASATGSPSGNITLSSTGATSKTIALAATLQSGLATGFGNALAFDGGDDAYQSAAPTLNNTITVEAWVYYTGQSDINTIVSNTPAGIGDAGLSFGINNWQTANGKVTLETGSTLQTVDANVVPVNTWTHIAMVATSNSVCKLYVNGVEKATSGTYQFTANSSTTLRLGSMNGSYRFTGTMDEVRIWTVARTEAELNATMNTELTGSEPGLYAYYNFNQGVAGQSNSSITQALDASVNGRHMTLNGFTKSGTTSNFVSGQTTGGSSGTATPITGTTTVCVGQTAALSNSTSGGTWSSSNTSIATVNSSTGVVTGVAYGSATITYTYTGTNGCPVSVTTAVSVNAVPVITASGNTRCGSGAVNLTATATNSGTISWYSTSSNGTAITTGSTYQPSVSVGSTTYYAGATNGCGSSASRASAVATAYALPDAPTVTSAERCGAGVVALGADGGANTVRWYANGGSTVLTTGATYTTPVLSATTSYEVEALSGDGCVSATKTAVTATISNTATWNSASNEPWNTAANWSCGTVPDGSLSLTVASGTVALSSDLNMASGKTLTLGSGANMVVGPGATLTLLDGSTLSNSGTLTLDADATGYGQLLIQGTYTKVGSGKVVARSVYDVTGNAQSPWIHVSSPLSGSVGQLGNVTASNVVAWRAASAAWVGMTEDSTFRAGKGYTAYVGTNGIAAGPTGTLELEGDPFDNITPRFAYNSGANSSATFVDAGNRAGWNLLGNPFTCNLDFEAMKSTVSGLNNSFARWNPKKAGALGGGFDIYAPASVGLLNAAIIPPMGAAWVQTSGATAPTVSGPLKQKDHGRKNGRNFSNKGEGVDKLLVVVSELSNPMVLDEMSLAMVPGTSDGFNPEWDGRELLNSWALPNVYTDFDGDKISAKSVDFNLNSTQSKVVPVGVISTQEMRPYRIHLDETWAQPGYTVYLKDKLLKNVHKLSTADYVFAYTSAMEDRFELILTNAKTGALGLEEASRGALSAWVNGSELWINGLEAGNAEIDVVGMDGRVVAQNVVRAESGQLATVAIPELPAGLYTVRVRSNGLERGVRVAVQR